MNDEESCFSLTVDQAIKLLQYIEALAEYEAEPAETYDLHTELSDFVADSSVIE